MQSHWNSQTQRRRRCLQQFNLQDVIESLEEAGTSDYSAIYNSIADDIELDSNGARVTLALTGGAAGVVIAGVQTLIKNPPLNITAQNPAHVRAAIATCKTHFPHSSGRLPSVSDLPDGPTSKQECYQSGSLGNRGPKYSKCLHRFRDGEGTVSGAHGPLRPRGHQLPH